MWRGGIEKALIMSREAIKRNRQEEKDEVKERKERGMN